MKYLAPIVEGHGEIEAVPALLHRIAQATNHPGQLIVNSPLRVKSGSFLADNDYFKKQVILASAKAAQRSGHVLILLDCEDHCPAELGPKLLKDALTVRSDVAMITALAFREFESWFIAAAPSLGGLFGLPSNLNRPLNIDGIRDAKGWLGARMGVGYDPIVHQLEFTRKFDLEQAKQSHSFARFFKRIADYLNE